MTDDMLRVKAHARKSKLTSFEVQAMSKFGNPDVLKIPIGNHPCTRVEALRVIKCSLQ